MKELTIKEKAQAYDKAIINGSRLLECGEITRECYEYIFPELKESEGERIRKELIEEVKEQLDCIPAPDCRDKEDEKALKRLNNWLSWLEKQDNSDNIIEKAKTEKQRVLITETNGDANIDWDTRSLEDTRKLLKCGLQYINAELEKQGKQKLVEKYNIKGIGSKNAQGKLGEMIKNLKPDDKVEPKFKIEKDKWYVCLRDLDDSYGTRAFHKGSIYYSTKDETLLPDNSNVPFEIKYCVNDYFRPWTIQDAKDGDVLAAEQTNDYSSPFIAIYKERGLDYFNSYCFISFDAKFYTGDTGHDMTDIHPATKKQRDALMKAMADAGYTFDFDKKELKKIGDKNPLLSDFFKAEYERGKADAQKSAWSEEDKRMIDTIIFDLERHGGDTTYSAEVDWLKQFQPKQEWSKEEQQIIEDAASVILGCINAAETKKEEERLEKLADKLQDLRPQKQWKPTEEQLKSLKSVIDVGYFTSYPNSLETLYEQLKKLKGEIKL